MKRKNSPAAAIKCLHDSDSFVDVNFVGDVCLKVRKAEVVLREESPNEVRVSYEEFKTDVTALFLAVHNGNVTIVRKLLSIGAYVNQKLFRGYSTTIDGDKPVNNLSSANLDCANDEVKFESRGGVPLFHESNKVQAKLEDEILNVKLQRKVNSSLVCGTSMCVDVEVLDREGISLESAVETESQSKSSGSWTLSLFFWTLAAVMTVIPNCGTNDVYVAYLPLAHVFELVAETVMMAGDASIGYSLALTLTDTSNKIKKGTQGDASVLKHTLMTGGFYFSNLQKVFRARLVRGKYLKRSGSEIPWKSSYQEDKFCCLVGGKEVAGKINSVVWLDLEC